MAKARTKSNGNGKSKMRGFFATLRMTAETCNSKSKSNSNSKSKSKSNSNGNGNGKQKPRQRRSGWLNVRHPTHREVRDGWGTRSSVGAGNCWGKRVGKPRAEKQFEYGVLRGR
jgi:hypothetical protein